MTKQEFFTLQSQMYVIDGLTFQRDLHWIQQEFGLTQSQVVSPICSSREQFLIKMKGSYNRVYRLRADLNIAYFGIDMIGDGIGSISKDCIHEILDLAIKL